MRHITRLTGGILAFILLVSGTASLAATLSGMVTDEVTGQPIRFATAKIKELNRSVHTDADGRFVFFDIAEGSYTIVVKAHGYESRQWFNQSTSQLTAGTFRLAKLDAATMASMARELLESTRRTDTFPSHWSVRGFQSYLGLFPGTVQRYYGAPLHIRGSAANEVAFFVDGQSQVDPFTGYPISAISHNAITSAQLQSGFISPAYGGFAGGMGEVVTREAGSHWHGSIEASADDSQDDGSDYRLLAVDLAGPLTAGSDKLTVAAAGEGRNYGDRNPGSSSDWNWLNTWQGKISWRATDRLRAGIGTRGSYLDWKYTPRAYMFDARHAPRGVDENYSVWTSIGWEFGQTGKATGELVWTSNKHRQGDGTYFDELWSYGRPGGNGRFDQTQLFYSWDDMSLNEDSLQIGHHVVNHTPIVESLLVVPLPGGDSTAKSFVVRGDESNLWDDLFLQKTTALSGRFEFVNDVSVMRTTHALRLGYQFESYSVRSYHHLFPTNIYKGINGGFDDIDRYGYDLFGEEEDGDSPDGAKHPLFSAAYFSDHTTIDEFTIDAGIRYDFLDYDAYELISTTNPLDPYDAATYADTAHGLTDQQREYLRQQSQVLSPDELKKRQSYGRVSPRVAVSYPASDNATLHASYGHYLQRPAFENIYSNFDYLEYKVRTGGYHYAFGNAAIEPTRTEQYDFGAEFRPADEVRLDATWFRRDVRNPIDVITQPAAPNSFDMLVNGGAFESHGLEVQARLMPVHGLSGLAGYTYSTTDRKYTYGNTQQNISWTVGEAPPQFAPAEWDQKHKITLVADARSGNGAGPEIAKWHPLENAGLSAIFAVGSGFPYSAVAVYNEVTLGAISPKPAGAVFSARTPWTTRLDLRVDKEVSAFGTRLDLYLWGINVLDRGNVVEVYQGSGEPDNTGWLQTPDGQSFVQNNGAIHDSSFLTGEQKYRLRENDPSHYDIPRQLRFGLRVVL